MSETNFLWFLGAGIAIAFFHALLPNHWLPFIAAARFHKWTSSKLFRFTLSVAIAHAAMTVALSIIVSLLGEGFAHLFHERATKIAGLVMMVLGVFFFLSPKIYSHKHIHHHECEHCQTGSQVITLAGLFVALALSPCEGLLLIFFATSVKFGWYSSLIVALISGSLTVILMVSIVLLAHKGWNRLLPQLQETHERLLASSLMMILGTLMLLKLGH
ncbi:MAG: hypothetical protein NZ937_01155 [Armatimonadetes bacterium]|nr:hypothetical protein [Armatimonadota bacterium]